MSVEATRRFLQQVRLYTFIIRGEVIVNKIEAVPFSPPYICRAAFSDDVLDEM